MLRGLGKGSFGDVYLGEHIREPIQAAVKILRSRLTRSEELKEFINEARTIRLKHPHIVPLLDFGIGSDDVPFLVMEYAPHGSLRDRYPKGSQLPLSTIVSYVTPIASALQYAHDQHLIHRDVKPENMLVGLHRKVLLTDFGIAAVAHSSHSLITEQGVGGTLPYMAPEQIQGKPWPASDQYALGVVVYEWLCGTRPFNGMAAELVMQHNIAVPPSLREQVPTLTKDVEQVVLRALAKDPKQRFARVQDFAEALEAARLSVRNSSSIPSFHVPTVPPLPVEKTNRLVDRSGSGTAFLPPVLEPRPLVTRSREQALEYVTEGSASPVVPVSKIEHPSLQREATPRSISWNRFFPGRTAVLIGLVLLIVAGSVGIAFTTISHHLTSAQVTVTAKVKATLTAKANVQRTATAHTQATVMAAANAYATAVATNGIMFGFNAQHTDVNPYEQILNSTTVSRLIKQWTYPTRGSIFSSPVVANGVVYVGSDALYAIDATSGSKKWAYPTGTTGSSPAVANGVVYIGSKNGNLYAIDATSGSKKWAYQTGTILNSSPAVVNGIVYVVSEDGNLYAIDATSGSKKWAYPTGSTDSSPAVVNGIVYVGSDALYAIDATSGSKKWAYQTGTILNSSPAVVNGIVYVVSEDGNLYAIDATSGSRKWAYPTGSAIYFSPAVANGVVYIGSNNGNLYAIDATSGSRKWYYSTGSAIYSSPTVANGVVYIGSNNGNLYAIDATSGSRKWYYSTGSAIYSSPTVANGVVYVGSNDRNLYAFDLPVSHS